MKTGPSDIQNRIRRIVVEYTCLLSVAVGFRTDWRNGAGLVGTPALGWLLSKLNGRVTA
jgi:hypothetical protein